MVRWVSRIARVAVSTLGLVCLFGGATLEAQATGRVVGRVLNSANAEPLQSAQVSIAALGLGGLTALDGRYVLREVPEGAYELTVQLIGFGTKVVTGVQVVAGRTATLDVRVTQTAIEFERITVTASAERGSTTSLLTERRTASIVSDAIGRDQIDRSPDGDAAAALKRVPGMSVVDGKFAYVRGLGERYSSTTLNGAPLASPVPDKKVIPLDLFPSSLLESIVTAKSYSPDQPGDYAGGLVKLQTRAFPENRLFEISLGGGWNSVGTFSTALGYDSGSGTDFLGFDDGARDLPIRVPSARVSSSNYSDADLQIIGRSFEGDWGPTTLDIPPNLSFGVTYGDDFDLGDDERFGFIASANYSNAYDVRHDQIERVFAQSGVDDPEVDYRGDMTTRSVQLGGLLNLTYQPAASHQIRFSGIYNRLADDLARQLEGFNLDSNTDQLNTRLQYLATELINLQLSGEHVLPFGGARVEWRGAGTRANRYEPNTREVLYRKTGNTYLFDDFVQSGSIFHQDQSDDGWSGGLTFKMPFELNAGAASLGLGATTDRKDRETFTRRFRFRPYRGGNLSDSDLALPPNDLFGRSNIEPLGLAIEEATFREDNYSASEVIDAAFIQLEIEPIQHLRLSGGVRIENSAQEVDPHDLFGSAGLEPAAGAELDVTDWLPALNVTYSLGERTNLRGSLSSTLARPQLRELAPFSFADYAGGYLISGNPALDRSRIRNLDLRWEWFPQPNAVVAVSGFHKSFHDPIEVLVLPSTELIRSWVNAPSAANYGAEIELRSGLGVLTPALENVRFNGNLTLVSSSVEAGGSSRVFIPGVGVTELETIDRERALQGQSPYVANVGLTWFDPESDTSASLLVNRFGRRIDAVGRESSPDIYEEARSQLDFVIERPVRHFKVKLSASRLLGNMVEFTQGGGLLREYDLGRSVSLSASWSLTR